MIVKNFRSLWNEPALPRTASPDWWGWVLVMCFSLAAIAEGLFRPDLEWRVGTTLTTIILVFGLLWRYTHPMLTLVITFESLSLMELLAQRTRCAGRDHTRLAAESSNSVCLMPASLTTSWDVLGPITLLHFYFSDAHLSQLVEQVWDKDGRSVQLDEIVFAQDALLTQLFAPAPYPNTGPVG